VPAQRVLVALVPDWPVVAACCGHDVPAAVVAANQVLAVTAAARAEGVRTGLRRREAQARCPELAVLAADPGRNAREWEPVVAAVEALLTPVVEVLEPGALAFATRGPSRYFGGDAALGQKVAGVVDRVLGRAVCQVGVADGLFAGRLAARAATGARVGAGGMGGRAGGGGAGGLGGGAGGGGAGGVGSGSAGGTDTGSAGGTDTGSAGGTDTGRMIVVPPGKSRPWLSPHPVGTLGPGYEGLTDLLVRLGIRTLGNLAELPGPSVLGRFGPEGAAAHRLARGLDEHPLEARIPPPDLVVQAELDPPEERVEAAAFVAKSLAHELLARVESLGLACSKVAIEVETEHGERLVRHWRHDGALTAVALSERARWQIEGWLAQGLPTAGLTLLRLIPEEVRPDRGRQLGFWGGMADTDARAARSFARVQGMLGPDAVATAVLAGGRGFADQVRLVPWGDERDAGGATAASPPWPGRLANPSPAAVHSPAPPAEVLDASGEPVEVSSRGAISAAPAAVSIQGGPWNAVVAWAGPWPLEERWWENSGRRRARLQVILEEGEAHLLTRESGRWWVEATYE
jgi:protein ImuB